MHHTNIPTECSTGRYSNRKRWKPKNSACAYKSIKNIPVQQWTPFIFQHMNVRPNQSTSLEKLRMIQNKISVARKRHDFWVIYWSSFMTYKNPPLLIVIMIVPCTVYPITSEAAAIKYIHPSSKVTRNQVQQPLLWGWCALFGVWDY